MLDDILLQVQKPARYIGQEWNVSKKDFNKCDLKFALCFPDLYEVGMSNLGIRIIYGILNSIPDVCCERFFSPAQDMENILRNHNMEITSLESQKTLKEFDLIGFSLGYELNYTNVLNILDLGGIPLKSALRSHAYPLVIAGGPCAFNPEPMHEFFDLFVIGEAEEVILEIIDVYRKFKFKSGEINKPDLLLALSGIEGVYVPSLYKVRYNPDGKIEEFKPKIKDLRSQIKKRFVKDLNSSYYPLEWLTPYIQIIHDRVTLEIMRGCPNRCSFCQARSGYFPFRFRNIEGIANLASQLYRHTGYEEISLSGLSVTDYPQIQELLKVLISSCKEKTVSVSLPSIKPNDLVGNLSQIIASIKKTGLTFAPEAATEKLRKIINKDFDIAGFFKALEEAYFAGYRHVKLYFMIGLPFEENEDLDGIIDFSISASNLRKKLNHAAAQVNISVNTLIPKPHTALQWFEMESLEGIKNKQDYLKGKIRNNKRLKLSLHNPLMSLLEGVLSRGDRRLASVILSAFMKGARFDSWDNYFNYNQWKDAFNEAGLDPQTYLEERRRDEFLPWDFLDVGINKDTLREDFHKISEA